LLISLAGEFSSESEELNGESAPPFFVEHVSQRAPHWYIRICFFLFQIVVKPNLMATHHLPIQINT
jgi:hypothetical protein